MSPQRSRQIARRTLGLCLDSVGIAPSHWLVSKVANECMLHTVKENAEAYAAWQAAVVSMQVVSFPPASGRQRKQDREGVITGDRTRSVIPGGGSGIGERR